MADNEKLGKQFADIAHPNKSAPSNNSKSVIITHGAVMQDPMVVANPVADIEPPKPQATVTPQLTIQPLSAPLLSTKKDIPALAKADDETGAETKPESSATPLKKDAVAESSVAQATSEAAVKESFAAPGPIALDTPKLPAQPATDAPTENSNDEGDEGSVTPQALQEAAEAAAKKAEEEVQLLIETKKYFLPIKTTEQRRTKRTVILGILFSVVLIAAWADIALDAGLIQLAGIHSLTHFFSS